MLAGEDSLPKGDHARDLYRVIRDYEGIIRKLWNVNSAYVRVKKTPRNPLPGTPSSQGGTPASNGFHNTWEA